MSGKAKPEGKHPAMVQRLGRIDLRDPRGFGAQLADVDHQRRITTELDQGDALTQLDQREVDLDGADQGPELDQGD